MRQSMTEDFPRRPRTKLNGFLIVLRAERHHQSRSAECGSHLNGASCHSWRSSLTVIEILCIWLLGPAHLPSKIDRTLE